MLLELAETIAGQIADAGVAVALDPRGFAPKPVCALVQPPTFEVRGGGANATILALRYPIQIAAAGPANLQTLTLLYAAVDLVVAALDVTDGRPIAVTVGELTYPGYELTLTFTATN